MKRNKGITLVALIVTIIVLLILAGVTLNTVFGDEGIITKANVAKMTTTFANAKEQFHLFAIDETSRTNGAFQQESLYASEFDLRYNTKKEDEEGNIFDIIQDLEKSKYKDRFDVIKGELIITPANEQEKDIAISLGIKVSPYIIENGVLMSADNNLALVDSTGTVTIPSKATAIAEGCFANVEGIKTVIIPGTVKVIGSNAFSNNTTLEEVIIEEGVETIKSQAFKFCVNLRKVQMGNSITNIGGEAFTSNKKLKEINISNKIKVISSNMLSGCSSLESIVIPESVIQINSNAFGNCKSLTEINIPKNLEIIDSNAFNGCSNLSSIQIDPENQYFAIESNILMTKDRTEMKYIFASSIEGTTFRVPNTVTKLTGGLLSLCQQIETVIVPASVTEISANFFNGNKKIKSIQVDDNNPNYISTTEALYNKAKTKLIYYYYANQTEVTLPESVTTIGTCAFGPCTNSTTVNLPDSVTTLGSHIVSYAPQVKTLKLGKKVKDIEMSTFWDGRAEVIIDEANPYYIAENNGIYTKDKTKLVARYGSFKSFVIPCGVIEIGEQALRR